ncbi:MAG: hypothetical protein SynsKO_40820 [Synoicihabitans sp.]
MKTKLQTTTCLLAASALLSSFALAGDEEKKNEEVRVIVGSDKATSAHEWVHKSDDHKMFVYSHDDHESGPRTFLGVETSNVSATLGKQLGLPRGIGLVVARVVPDTGAAEVLEKHDILVKFEDQLMVSGNQLGVLVQSKEPGTEVELTIMRGGKEQVVVAKLGEKKAKTMSMKLGAVDADMIEKLRGSLGDSRSDLSREDVEGLMGKLRGKSSGLFFSDDKGDGPVVRMMKVNRGTVVFTDDEGTVKLIADEGPKRLVVVDGDENTIFDGPVGTAAEREALSEAIKSRLKKVESLESLQMDTDADFHVEEDVIEIVPHASTNGQVSSVTLVEK